MYKEILEIVNRIKELIQESEVYLAYKDDFLLKYRDLTHSYTSGKIHKGVYEVQLQHLTKGKTKKEMIEYYNAYIYSLLKQVETLNGEMFYIIYKDKSEGDVIVDEKLVELVNKAKENTSARRKAEALKKTIELENIRKEEQRKEKIRLKLEEKRRVLRMREVEKARKQAESDKIAKEKAKIRAKKLEEKLKAKSKGKSVSEENVEEGMSTSVKKSRGERKADEVDKNREDSIFTVGSGAQRIELEKKTTAFMKHASRLTYFFSKLFGLEEKETVVGKENKINPSLMRLEKVRMKAGEELKAETISATLLTEEAKKIHSILERKKGGKGYQTGLYINFANRFVKKTSYVLLNQFPNFFKNFYTSLRLANINMLSNTYVNVTVLSTMLGFLSGLFLFFIFFLALGQPMVSVVVKTIIFSLLLGVIIFMAFYSLPLAKISKRRRSINTNLPFAINHMSAVVGSGVSPTRMFELISESQEYGEIAIEIAKIVEFIKLFGYDILTALRTVAATTPSPAFKDFFEGLISNVESGGDIKDYLIQKAEEAMTNYEMERKKYVETISTYSDIYTGILIAAPLFFIASLSLVSMLGGAIGGMDVNLIIILGTYLVIPLLNVLFLIFLAATQPEI